MISCYTFCHPLTLPGEGYWRVKLRWVSEKTTERKDRTPNPSTVSDWPTSTSVETKDLGSRPEVKGQRERLPTQYIVSTPLTDLRNLSWSDDLDVFWNVQKRDERWKTCLTLTLLGSRRIFQYGTTTVSVFYLPQTQGPNSESPPGEPIFVWEISKKPNSVTLKLLINNVVGRSGIYYIVVCTH